ncbi:PREDICTED: uncharacterized protein LOC108558450 isoform X1 [Nicrophorus vespilloides]|uniref:Uncharacterized protein LOC108558450 isoform X1 n=1 Tax=Nicrophorus vespilloides TaxID=110193 RepID=A0ABM1M8F2_NICVS|nr:PREDICTED: uncharacterized protein LOC108558450 isoform X1 [Nicrophorus vespilloides]
MASVTISNHHHAMTMKTPPSRDSVGFTSTKGLLNAPGQNNCFLNSAVQVLWHLDIFRRSFRDLTGHACMAESCIFCALKELFSQLQFSHETALPPDALRRALAESFFDQQRFQLGFMDDAAECFENMLLRIHMHIAHGEAEDMCNARHCIPHQKFAMTLVEQSICGACNATSEPLSFTQMVHYVSASALTTQVRQSMNSTNIGIQDTFGLLLKKAGSMGDIRDCPSSCGAKIQICRTLMNRPEIVSVGIVWDSERPTLEHIMDVFATVGTTLRLSDVFHSVVDNRWADMTTHNLVGVVTYYGKHYSTFFFHTKLRVWIYFDDATVREVGPRWDQVVEKCRRGRYQPLLLLYAVPGGSPVCTENAPKQITPFNGNDNKRTLRRSITPSPEKPNIGNTRRAITPNPDRTLAQTPPLLKNLNEYQNLSVIQDNIYGLNGVDEVDGDMGKEAEYITRKTVENVLSMQQFAKPQVNIHRTLSNSSSNTDGINIPEHLNVARRRDSGNWSGDRNSASSSSSTTMENPYLYLVGKMPHGNGSLPGSPTRGKSDCSSGSSGVYDAGYDSYSLSSNDSSTMSTIQHLMKMGHLAKIPEDYSNVQQRVSMPSCDELCDEADELLSTSRQLEDKHDLVLALALCNAAATKARAAMNAPYNNQQTLTLAMMKHSTCIMRARSLHRRMTQTQNPAPKENPIEIRHTREGSSGSGRHSRQNSREKGMHSRQNSRELLNALPVSQPEKAPIKNIEIYATLPKKKDLKNKMSSVNIEDEEYMIYDKPPERETRSIFSRSRNKEANKIKEKRSRSEDRLKLSKDFSLAPETLSNTKDTLKREKNKEEKEDKKDKSGKKQHKIRRKLLMGGLIRRKNRSMPDLTEGGDKVEEKPVSVDDSGLGVQKTETSTISGYLSEGHLEFNSTNPNLERSKLMRKSFHGNAGKVLTAAKVPPPPPLRTTSQLSKSKLLNGGEEEKSVRPMYSLPQDTNYYQNNYEIYQNHNTVINTVITTADVHQEQSPAKQPSYQIDSGVDEVDCFVPSMDLPPYPSPAVSAMHSRQPSEEFPPPPPPLDLSALDEYLPSLEATPNSLLAQLQNKRQEILSQDHLPHTEVKQSSGENWLRELQAKQAALRMKRNADPNVDPNQQMMINKISCEPIQSEAKITSVKDLASRFENIPETKYEAAQYFQNYKADNTVQTGVLSLKKRDENDTSNFVAPEQIAQEIREVEMLNAVVQKTLHPEDNDSKRKLAKKKSVSFCDQVILVATAEEQEDDSYIPNPILERVLRSAIHKPEAAAIRQEIMSLREIEMRKENDEKEVEEEPTYVGKMNYVDQQTYSPQQDVRRMPQYNGEQINYSPQQPLQQQQQQQNYPPMNQMYVRQNSLDNLLSRPAGMQTSLSREERDYIIQNPPQMDQRYQQLYGTSPQNNYRQYNRYQQQEQYAQMQKYPVRQSPTLNYQQAPIYQHPPSPSPSTQSYNNQRIPYQYPQYQRVPMPQDYPAQRPQNIADPNSTSPYQRIPQDYNDNSPYQRVPPQNFPPQEQQTSPYLRVPPPNGYKTTPEQISPYLQTLPPKQLLKKQVSFEPGTKGGAESPTPKAIVTPIIVNNNMNNNINNNTNIMNNVNKGVKCNLCRKKTVSSATLYCADCEFYMSRFKPKT